MLYHGPRINKARTRRFFWEISGFLSSSLILFLRVHSLYFCTNYTYIIANHRLSCKRLHMSINDILHVQMPHRKEKTEREYWIRLTLHIEHKVLTSTECRSVLYVSSSELGHPQPLSRKRVCPPPWTEGEAGQTRLRVGGGGVRRLEKKLSTLSW